jgi:maltose O-acetyltransferase
MRTHVGLRDRLRELTTGFVLRAADRVGRAAVVEGWPHVVNAGTLHIGDDFRFGSRPAVSHLVVMPNGRAVIGDRVTIAYGAAISTYAEVSVGDDTRIGPFAVIMDSDFHVAGDRSALAEPAPVRIGRGVVIGSRVTILRGSTIGDGARVESGSVVSGDVAEGSVVSGVPARTRERAEVGAVDVPELVMRTLGLSVRPQPGDGPHTIPEWDSLGALKLLLAMEDTFGIVIREELSSARTIARLQEIAQRASQLGA